MSLEAVAALLGHRSPKMTGVYARISSEVVAEQYFAAIAAMETQAQRTVRRQRTPRRHLSHRRLLGNGHCTRPVELDCRFQTICEGCGFFQTSEEFIPILRRQHQTRSNTTTFHEPRSSTSSSFLRHLRPVNCVNGPPTRQRRPGQSP